jgi:hypothetical protein
MYAACHNCFMDLGRGQPQQTLCQLNVTTNVDATIRTRKLNQTPYLPVKIHRGAQQTLVASTLLISGKGFHFNYLSSLGLQPVQKVLLVYEK